MYINIMKPVKQLQVMEQEGKKIKWTRAEGAESDFNRMWLENNEITIWNLLELKWKNSIDKQINSTKENNWHTGGGVAVTNLIYQIQQHVIKFH